MSVSRPYPYLAVGNGTPKDQHPGSADGYAQQCNAQYLSPPSAPQIQTSVKPGGCNQQPNTPGLQAPRAEQSMERHVNSFMNGGHETGPYSISGGVGSQMPRSYVPGGLAPRAPVNPQDVS